MRGFDIILTSMDTMWPFLFQWLLRSLILSALFSDAWFEYTMIEGVLAQSHHTLRETCVCSVSDPGPHAEVAMPSCQMVPDPPSTLI